MSRRSYPVQSITRREAAEIINALLDIIGDASSEGTTLTVSDINSTLTSLARRHGLMIPRKCLGEAHSNPFIDSCCVCMPHWGVVRRDVVVT